IGGVVGGPGPTLAEGPLEHAKVERGPFEISLNRRFQLRRPLERQDPHAEAMHQREDHERVLGRTMGLAKQDRSSSCQARLKPALSVGPNDEREVRHREALYGSPELWRAATSGIQGCPQAWPEDHDPARLRSYSVPR